MVSIIEAKKQELAALCRQWSVRKLALFGSAVRGEFDSQSSDLDFIVEFLPASPTQHADCYFGLQEDLEKLFLVPIDLIEPEPIHNPYFLQELEESQVVLYDAA